MRIDGVPTAVDQYFSLTLETSSGERAWLGGAPARALAGTYDVIYSRNWYWRDGPVNTHAAVGCVEVAP